jgi:hypothetical protein
VGARHLAYLAVHNGHLDSRDNVRLRAIHDGGARRSGSRRSSPGSWAATTPATSSALLGYDPEVPFHIRLARRKAELVRIGRDAREQLTVASLHLVVSIANEDISPGAGVTPGPDVMLQFPTRQSRPSTGQASPKGESLDPPCTHLDPGLR